jgi:hypothetical protein
LYSFLGRVLRGGEEQAGQWRSLMERDYEEELETIIGELQCSNDLRCYRSGLEDLCKAKDIGLESFLECLEENPNECRFSVPYGHSFFCKCPLRVHMAKNLKKQKPLKVIS